MKICFAIYMLGMAVLATFEPSLPVARDALRTVSAGRMDAALRPPMMASPVGAVKRTAAAEQH